MTAAEPHTDASTNALADATADARPESGDAFAPAACLDPVLRDTLSAYLRMLLELTPEVAAGTGPLDYSSFLAAPGMPAPPAMYERGQRTRACNGPSIDAPLCSEPAVPDGPTSCVSFECTGVGTGWRAHRLPDPMPLTLGDFDYQQLIVSTRYEDGEPGIEFFNAARMSGPGEHDYSFEARGHMQDDALEVTVVFGTLFAAGEAESTFTTASMEGSGRLTVAGIEVAALDGDV